MLTAGLWNAVLSVWNNVGHLGSCTWGWWNRVQQADPSRNIMWSCVCVPDYINLLCVYRFNVTTPHITKGSSVRSVYLLLVHNLFVSFVGRLSLSLFSLWEIHYDFTMFLTSFSGCFFLSQNFFFFIRVQIFCFLSINNVISVYLREDFLFVYNDESHQTLIPGNPSSVSA